MQAAHAAEKERRPVPVAQRERYPSQRKRTAHAVKVVANAAKEAASAVQVAAVALLSSLSKWPPRATFVFVWQL